MFAPFIKRSNIFKPLITVQKPSAFCSSVTNLKNNEVRSDKLFKKIRLEVRSNDRAVIDSYIEFARLAAENLNINFTGIDLIHKKPHRSYVVERQICLRSAFVHKKHREQYEWRTYIKFANFVNLTESTADTFLEYVERNLPEGCSMIVHKFEATKMIDHLQPPVEELQNVSKTKQEEINP